MPSKSPSETRRCCLCLKERPLTSRWFERVPQATKGFSYECKDCASIRNRIGYRRRRLAEAQLRIPKMDELVSATIEHALRLCDGSASAAARALGIGRATIYRYTKKLGTKPSDYKNPDHAELAELEARWKELRQKRRIHLGLKRIEKELYEAESMEGWFETLRPHRKGQPVVEQVDGH